ncbi:hypothetical protein D9619_008782 [Psilocybe cf. subviscida]|uniref:Uncharacterized protein n=1 Tax=Psilocybe cf. subviscida TaxID=2480587 RepID=A0A8H5B9C1_9AGAR|nr:hypothetical protein D9619_008782 [Psilocybe cf. subviscida]
MRSRTTTNWLSRHPKPQADRDQPISSNKVCYLPPFLLLELDTAEDPGAPCLRGSSTNWRITREIGGETNANDNKFLSHGYGAFEDYNDVGAAPDT